jgi:hypothetical protein
MERTAGGYARTVPEGVMADPGDLIDAGLRRLGGYQSIYVPEFVWNGFRIDAIVIDLRTRWIRGFEIKRSRGDFRRDEKWTLYSQFCSSLSIVCPEGVVQASEVDEPFGLLWVLADGSLRWAKKLKRFQHRESLAWLWTYVQVLEYVLPRAQEQNRVLRQELRWLHEEQDRIGKKGGA